MHGESVGAAELCAGSFVLGLVESFLYGAYAGLVFVPIHNFVARRCGELERGRGTE